MAISSRHADGEYWQAQRKTSWDVVFTSDRGRACEVFGDQKNADQVGPKTEGSRCEKLNPPEW
jgi:hypothetical protein